MPASPISYALPTHENLDPDEDWSRISDRKMKKRLQNRVAQREYRRRTRERIEELTAELNEYRRQAHEPRVGSAHEPQSDGNTSRSPSPQEQQEQALPPPSTQQQGQEQQPQQQQPQQQPQQQDQEQPQQNQEQQSQQQSQQQQQYQQELQHHHDGSQLVVLADTVNACPPSSTVSTSFIPSLLQSTTSSSLLSSSAAPSSGTQQGAIISNSTATRLPSNEIHNIGRSGFAAEEPRRTPVSEPAGRVYQHQDDVPFLPLDMDDDGGVSDSMSMLLTSQSPLAHPLPHQHQHQHQHALHPPAPDALMQAPDAPITTGPNHCTANRDRPNIWDWLPGADDSLEQQFDFLFDWVQHAGFGSLDHLFEVWYTGNFNDSSPLRQEQRLSRHRGLTTLLAKLRGSTHWSKWERWGYQEETLQGAESILRAEFSALMQCAHFERHVAMFGARSDPDEPNTMRALKRCLQDELPQLRTLLTAVTAESGKTGRHTNRKAIDAATLILSMAGRVSDADLLVMLQNLMQNRSSTPHGAKLPG